VVSCRDPGRITLARLGRVRIRAGHDDPTTSTGKENHAMNLAYLDAASGSMLVQAIVAGAAGAAVFLKLFWRRLTGPLRRRAASTSRGDER